MGNYNYYSGSITYNSGFNGALFSGGSKTDGIAFPASKYVNIYTTSSVYTSSNLQHALTEASHWYGDYTSFVTSEVPWLKRGGTYFSNFSEVGIFSSLAGYGSGKDSSSSTHISFRPTIVK